MQKSALYVALFSLAALAAAGAIFYALAGLSLVVLVFLPLLIGFAAAAGAHHAGLATSRGAAWLHGLAVVALISLPLALTGASPFTQFFLPLLGAVGATLGALVRPRLLTLRWGTGTALALAAALLVMRLIRFVPNPAFLLVVIILPTWFSATGARRAGFSRWRALGEGVLGGVLGGMLVAAMQSGSTMALLNCTPATPDCKPLPQSEAGLWLMLWFFGIYLAAIVLGALVVALPSLALKRPQ